MPGIHGSRRDEEWNMSLSLGARGNASAEINVTPLIDVLLVLLIIFMVVLPHHRLGESADIPMPNIDHKPTRPDNIVLQLLDAGQGKVPTLKINHEPVGWDTLEGRLTEIDQLRSERVAFFKGDPEIDFQYVADALDIVHQAGVDRIGLMGERSAGAKDVTGAELKR
jgi:biopolymer transport protein TolR